MVERMTSEDTSDVPWNRVRAERNPVLNTIDLVYTLGDNTRHIHLTDHEARLLQDELAELEGIDPPPLGPPARSRSSVPCPETTKDPPPPEGDGGSSCVGGSV